MALRTLLGGRLAIMKFSLNSTRSLQTSSKALMGMGSHASDNDPLVLEKEKAKNLSGRVTLEHVNGCTYGF